MTDRSGVQFRGTAAPSRLTTVRAAFWTKYKRLNKLAVRIAGRDELSRRVMAVPDIRPVTGLTSSIGITIMWQGEVVVCW